MIVVVFHHIAGDGWSVGVLARELGVLYRTRVAGGGSPLARLPVQYGDFAVWQRVWLGGGVLARELGYWRSALAGAPGLLRLPLDRPRPLVSRHRGGVVAVRYDAAVVSGLRVLCRREGVTLFMALLAGFGLVLGRWSGQGEVVVGTPLANRLRGEVEGLIGFFVNTLALRLGVGGLGSGRDLLRQARAVAVAGYGHQAVPFEQVVEALQPERSLAHAPLFQAMLVLQNAPAAAVELSGLTVAEQALGSLGSKFDVTLSLGEAGGALEGALEYDADLFDAASMARLAGQVGRALAGLAADPAAAAHRLELVTAAERRRLLRLAAGPAPSVAPASGSVWDLVVARGAACPAAVAVEFGGGSLSYGALLARARGLGYRLRELGVGPEVAVGVALDRGLDLAVAVLAIWGAGGAYVPLDPSYPGPRLGYLVAESGIGLVLTSRAVAARLAGALDPARLLVVDAMAVAEDGPALPGPLAPHSLAYVIYTSGSTGPPNPSSSAMAPCSTIRRPGHWMWGPGGRILRKTALGFGCLGVGTDRPRVRARRW